ncbi:hypothetical protein Tco_1527750, partial [Tanacetum coccineum]
LEFVRGAHQSLPLDQPIIGELITSVGSLNDLTRIANVAIHVEAHLCFFESEMSTNSPYPCAFFNLTWPLGLRANEDS